jgi:lysozyme family protein
MSITTYKPFVDRMIGRYEGGYGWNPKDTGGPTKYGITCFDLAEHRGQRMNSMTTWAPLVRAMTLDEAEQIYATKYAAAIRYNDLPAGVDCEMLDYGVNSGATRPIRVVRAILGVPGPAVMDQKLLDAIRKTSPAKLISDISAERLHFMHAIRGGSAWAEFGGGWGARVADLKAYSLNLAAGTVSATQAPDLTKTSLPKARHGTPEITKTVIKRAAVGGAAGVAGSHLGGMSTELLAVLVGFGVIGAIGTVLFLKQKAATANATVILPPVATPIARAA